MDNRSMTGGHPPRCKGNRVERVLVCLLEPHGFAAARVPLSGAAASRVGVDLAVPLLGRDLWIEVKARAARGQR
jgi:Holliday junction resolvase